MASEYQIEQAILQYLNYTGWFAWKNSTGGFYDGKVMRKHSSNFNIRGASDIIAIKEGTVLFLEVKTTTGKQSTFQQQFEKNITSRGGIYHVVRSVQDTKHIVSQIEARICRF